MCPRARADAMCDCSLEDYRSRPAQPDKNHQTYRSPCGRMGFIGPADASAAYWAFEFENRSSRLRSCLQVTAATASRKGDELWPSR